VLVACLFAYEIIRFKRLTRFFAFAAGTFLLLAVLQNIFVHNEAGYLAQCKIRAKIVSVNVGAYAKGLYYMWGQGRDRVFHGVLFIILNGLAVIGFLARIRKKITFFEIFTLLYMGVLLVWPITARRFLIPVMPLYVYYVFSGVGAINVFERKAIETSAFILLIAAVFYSYGIRYEGMDFGPILNGVTKEESVQLFDYVKKEPDEGRVYIFRKPRVLALFTGRRASIYHQTEDDGELWYYFRKIGATHIIVGPSSLKNSEFFASFAERHWERLQKVFSNADFTVYAIIK